MTVRLTAAVGVMLAEQDADEPVPASVHEPLGVNVTVPPGVIAVPTSVSVTVAVHDVACPTTTVAGLHDTVVEVARLLTVTVVVTLLPACEGFAESPL